MLTEWLGAVETSSFAEWLRLSSWAYPTVNTAHIVGLALLFGAIVPLDLRLTGWRGNSATLATLAELLLPLAVLGFVLAAVSGAMLFTADARAYAASPFFQAKLVLIAFALGNAWLLRRVDWRSPGLSNRRLAVAGLFSMLAWLGVITLGRWIAYA